MASSLIDRIQALQHLILQIQQASNRFEQLEILNQLPIVQDFLKNPSALTTFLAGLTPAYDYAIKCVIAIGEGSTVFNMEKTGDDRFEQLRKLVESLLELELFYKEEGGIIGYHLTVLILIARQQNSSPGLLNPKQYLHPPGLTLEQSPKIDQQLIRWGIETLSQIGEMYPVGGAGERLSLMDEITGESLPVAKLSFLGRSLLEGIIRDLQAREYLYYKLFKKQLVTPIALMTSVEKNNHAHMLEIFKNHQWFGREPESFYFFTQPQVPVITFEGHWSLSAPLQVTFKPGGHGVLWKLAEEQGAFDWFESKQRVACLVRQINNPLAGTDQALLTLTGFGMHEKKSFGFLSCERVLNSAEGTNILTETEKEKHYCYCLTNIEYPEFDQKGIEETPKQPNSRYSVYPANTNILFANFKAIREALQKCSIPGQLINMKSKVPFTDSEGKLVLVAGGRLESTMQNIADEFVDCFDQQMTPSFLQKALKTFIIYNRREKTISTTKNLYKLGESPLSTPEQAYYDLLTTYYHLFKTNCQFIMPEWIDFDAYLKTGPSVLILFHPALGPLYQIIEQKIQRGSFAKGSELQLEIAEVLIEDLVLEGSLLIEALTPLGTFDPAGKLIYGQESRCILKQVTICNQGIDHQASQVYWKNQLQRKESVQIILEEGAEFYAENIILEGTHAFKVPAYHSLTLQALDDGNWVEVKTSLQKPSWKWNYTFNSDDSICLKQ
jgi:UTP---glucose-1-phosphate uridylyltransferase